MDSIQGEDQPSGPFIPKYSVKVPDAVKNGEVLKFTVKVFKFDSDDEVNTCSRQFDDLEWLQHCLLTQENSAGLILPPLPNRPEVDAKSAEKSSKKQLGNQSNVMMADNFGNFCRCVEIYLKQCIEHESFADNPTLEDFLCSEQAPSRTRIKRGILTKMSSMVEEAMKGQHKDLDNYYWEKREWCGNYVKAIKECSQNFNKLILCQMRLAQSYGSLAAALCDFDVYRDSTSMKVNQLLSKTAEGIEDAKRSLEVLSNNDERILAFQLDLYARYIDNVKDMLFKRTSLMIAFEDAKKALEKAKPNKREAAEEAKENAEKAFKQCSDVGKNELRKFKQHRIVTFQDELTAFADAHIKTAKDTHALLQRTLNSIKELDM